MFDSQMVVLSLGHAIVIFVVVSNVFSLLTFDKTKGFARDPCEYKELVPGDELPAGPLLVDVFFDVILDIYIYIYYLYIYYKYINRLGNIGDYHSS